MSIDILAALAETASRGNSDCKVQRWLDSIPDETTGKDDLVAAFTDADPTGPQYRTLEELDKLGARLGFITSKRTIGEHRAHRCRCFR